MHVENNFLVDLFFQMNPFSEVAFCTSLRNFQGGFFYYFIASGEYMFFKLLFQAVCKLRSSHSKTLCKTEEQVALNWSHNGRISATYGPLKFKKWTKGQCISTARWSKFCTGS